MLVPEPGLMIWTLITFGLAVLILWFLAFGPLQRVIDQRRAQIRGSMEAAEETRVEAARLLEEYQRTLAEVRKESEEILAGSRKAGESTRADILREAKEQAERTVDKAREQIERDTRAALKDLKDQVADLTLLATEKVISRSLTDAEHQRLIEEALEGIRLEELDMGKGE